MMNFMLKMREKSKAKKEEKAKAKTKKKYEKVKTEEIKKQFDVFVERPRLLFLVKLYFVFFKNIKLLIRSKVSALIFFFGPLLIVFLVALAFNTSTLYDLNVATYSESYSELTESIVSNLADNQYNVIRFENFEECIDAVKSGDFQVCIVFPSNLAVDNSANNIIEIFVDNSRLNIASLIASQVSTKVSIEASALSEDLVETILTVLDTTNTEVSQTQNLVEDLIAENKDLQNDISSTTNTAESLDLSYSDFSTTSIDDEISSITSSNNLSGSTFSTLNSLIDDFESAYDNLISTLDTADTNVDTISSSVSSLSSGLDTSAEDLASVEENLNDVSNSIDTITITNVENIVSPIKTSIEPLSSTNSYLFYILPALLVLLIMFVGLLMSSSNIVTEKTSQAFFRNFITPTNSLYFMIGEYLSNMLVLTLQVTVIMTILFLFFQDLGWQLFALAGLALLAIGSFFVILGMLIGYLFNTKEAVILGAVTSAIIMLFFSNTLLPLETLNSTMRSMLQFNPFVLGESMMKKILLFGSSFGGIAEPFYLLIGLSAAVLAGTIISQKFSKKYLANS
tara:strand:+ start:2376 stop:4079 length:1704 start_codon:yes stop_codon:yes gene_type:complete